MQNKKKKPPKPPLDIGRIMGELLAGAVGAIVGLAPVLWLACQKLKYGELGEFAGAVLVFLPLTYPLGAIISAGGVYLVGKTTNQTGSLGLTLGGGALGAATAFAIVVFTIAGDLHIDDHILFIIAFVAPTLGGVIGLNLTRRHRPPPAS